MKINAWVTKYALTKGVCEVEVELRGGYAYSTCRFRTQFRPEHWYRLRANAQAKAEDMRIAKIASLRKQIAKLEKLRFDGRRP